MINVSGFVFEDEAVAVQAKKEEEGVRFIREKSSLSNPQVVLKLYKTILQQKLFSTSVGLRFLIELQNLLLEAPSIPKEEIPPITMADFSLAHQEMPETDKKIRIRSRNKGERNYKKEYYTALFFAIVFGVSVLGMFLISEVSENNVNIINYRNEIINQYEKWEVELEDEEQRLKDWEKELKQREEQLNNEITP